jgi:peroxiredoxin
MTQDYTSTPDHLPVPQDDGAADHLLGMRLPELALQSTLGGQTDVSSLRGFVLIYCYPMTGQPGLPLPPGWDQIPGARGCTPQTTAYRDHYTELEELGVQVFGLSTQSTDYQSEMAERLHLPFPIVSDVNYEFQKALNMPTFITAGMTLLKRVTLIVNQGIIEAVHYPIFPSDSDAPWVVNYLKSH